MGGIIFGVSLAMTILGWRFTGDRDDIAKLFQLDNERAKQIDSLKTPVKATLYMTCVMFTERHSEQVPADCDAALRRLR